MSLVIRAYETRDLDACRQLWVDLTDRHRRIYESDDIGGEDPGKQFDEHLKRSDLAGVWVAEEEGEILGLIGLLHSEDETEVEPVVVRPGHRSKGIGKRLLQRAAEEAAARDVRYLSIKPVARNAEAIALFTAEGFDIVGHVQLLKILKPGKTRWRDGLEIHGRKLRY